jgi:predicted Rdx family selenoprotein
LAAAIEEEFPKAQVELIKGGKGNFIVIADGRQLWHKREMDNEFPRNDQVLAQLRG